MNSKAVMVAGIVLIALGVFGLARGEFSYTEEKHEAEIAGIELSVKDRETVAVPQWLSIGAIALGAVLLVAGRRRSEPLEPGRVPGREREPRVRGERAVARGACGEEEDRPPPHSPWNVPLRGGFGRI